MEQVLKDITSLVRIAIADSEQDTDPRLLYELSFHTFNYMDVIVTESSKGLVSTGKNCHQIYNSLVLIEYLLVNGNQLLSEKFTDHSSLIFKLNKYNCDDKPNMNVRIKDKSKKIISLLNSEEMLQEERLLAMKERNRKFLNKTNSQGTTPSHSSLKDDEETNKDGSDLAPDVNNNKSNHLYYDDVDDDDYDQLEEEINAEIGWTTVKEKRSKKVSIIICFLINFFKFYKCFKRHLIVHCLLKIILVRQIDSL